MNGNFKVVSAVGYEIGKMTSSNALKCVVSPNGTTIDGVAPRKPFNLNLSVLRETKSLMYGSLKGTTSNERTVVTVNVIIGCEESQEVCKAFRALGYNAYSCDLKPCSGGHPEWHIQCDVLEVLGQQIRIVTQDGIEHNIERWDLGIFHPTCTRLCNSGVMWLSKRDLWEEMRQGALFFKKLMDADIPCKAIENPIPHKYALEIIGRKYDQVIQPWMFGHGETKATCLWLFNLPDLKPTNIVSGRIQRLHRLPPSEDRAILRSKTYPGIAKAMAQQWGVLLPLNVNKKEDGFPPNNKLLGILPTIL